MKTKHLLILAMLVSTFLVTSETFGFVNQRESLRGLKGVEVLIELVSKDIENDGLTRMQLQTDVELRLRKAGVRVLTEEESRQATGRPMLHVQISSYKIASIGYAFNCSVSLEELAKLVRNPQIINLLPTWNKSSTGFTPINNLRFIREGLSDLVDQFINNYLAANPK